MRGYVAIGINEPRKAANIGALWRSAHSFEVALMFTIGGDRYRRHATDTTDAAKHVPCIAYPDFGTFQAARPQGATLVCIETTGKDSLYDFMHPESAVYLLGSEDKGLPEEVIRFASSVVRVDVPLCLNVATTGAIVLYDRAQKDRRYRPRSVPVQAA